MGKRPLKLTKARLKLLRQYADTSEGRFMQGLPGTTELWRPMGLLDWRGSQFGCHFYCITDAGRAALATTTP
jgi:hypothetical protein